MTEEKSRIRIVTLSRTLSILRSHNQVLSKERATSTHLREALIHSSKTQMISCISKTCLISKTQVKLGSLAQAQVLLAAICFRAQIHSIRIIQPCKCSCPIMKQIFLLFWASDLKELTLKCSISQNMFMSFRFRLIKD